MKPGMSQLVRLMVVAGLAFALAGCAFAPSTPSAQDAELTTPPSPTVALPPPLPPPVVAGKSHNPGPAVRAEQFRLAYRMMLDGRFDRAESKLVALVQQYEESKVVEGLDEIVFWLANCREQQGHSAAAAATYRQLVAQFPKSDYATDARERVSALGAAVAP